jgi:hypothetical protein
MSTNGERSRCSRWRSSRPPSVERIGALEQERKDEAIRQVGADVAERDEVARALRISAPPTGAAIRMARGETAGPCSSAWMMQLSCASETGPDC